MNPTSEFIDQLNREDIEQARRTSASLKLRAGGDLFDNACRWMLAGIRRERPGITNEEAMKELRRRIAIGDALENRL
jgi:hypothetical protein